MTDYSSFLEPGSVAEVMDFIASHWEETVRLSPADNGTLLGMPHPYTIPCRKGAFQELYYWDTYFTSLGLVGTGRADLAKGNALNLLAQVERFGFVPNGNRSYYLSRSQPPYLAALVGLVADALQDDIFAFDAAPLLAREHEFWIRQRSSPSGLAHHGHHATREELIEFFPTVRHRLGLPEARAEEHLDLAGRTMAECETGWDMNSRFDRRCPDFSPVDLNCSLWLYETLLAHWLDAEALWRERATQRRDRLNELCWDAAQGVWFDYDERNGRRSGVLTAATFDPLWTGLADEAQAAAVVKNALPRLEYDFGVCSVAPTGRPSPFQWDYPNGWPCIQHLVFRGLERYGYLEEARRVAGKYVATVCRSFAETGDLWEKYNILDGSHRTTGEAGYLINPLNLESGEAATGREEVPPAMLGWTAGVFVDAVALLGERGSFWLTRKTRA